MLRNVLPFGPGQQFPRRIKMRICLTCNAALGKDFELEASALLKPMIDGSEVTLSPQQQGHIACWVIKTSLLVTLSPLQGGHPERARAIAIIRDLIAQGVPPAQTLVRLFKTDIKDERVEFSPDQSVKYEAPPTAFFSVTTIGYLGWEMAIGPVGPILAYASQSADRLGFLRVWPSQWPRVQWPSSLVSTEDVSRLRMAYLRSSRPSMPAPVARQWYGPETVNDR